ncbi:glycoside hydrolase family 16 protein [Haliscomenobacter sp.]|uniref:glycoside hydrolase family 16 protein n=1 Tax=Haliscomenobacter sp. TaxID=2717303 RepID=UPI003BAA7B9E
MKWNHSTFINSFLLVLMFCVFWSCQDEDNVIVDRDYQLVWEDNFDGSAGKAPDATKWAYDIGIGPGNDGWGNQELQFYTNRPENVALDGTGNLAITARRESYAGRGFTSARLNTKGIFAQAYGRFEARIKMPWGPGIWPAFWMLGANIDQVTWPQCGEIDIMEYRGQEPNLIHGSVHGPGYSGGAAITKSYGFTNDRFDVDFHVFAVEWGKDFIDFYVDDVLYQRLTPEDTPGEWVYNQPFFIILNVAVGGNFVGFPTPQTPFPQTMLVDYVKVYKEVN